MFIGVDVGGTNTDAAIIGDEIFTLKVPNEEGIGGIFRKISELTNLKEGRVVVSTSLPLNLLLSKASQYPTCTVIIPGPGLNYEKKGKIISGFVNHRGDIVEDIDVAEVRKIFEQTSYHNVAISSKFSVRNARIEDVVFQLAKEYFDENVIALSHHTGGLNFPQRISTTVVNAKIKKTVFELTNTIKEFAGDFFYYKGDGGIIPYQIALHNPSELYNSSPAAVAIGAHFLTREKDALVIDIGGTTTDFVMIEDGKPKIIEKVEILGEKTLVRCVDSFSIPFGGDSAIENGRLLPLRKGKPVAFGGDNFTLTDVLNLEGFEIGNHRKSIDFARNLNINSNEILESFVNVIVKGIESVEAERIILTGYLGKFLSAIISKKAGVSAIVPEHSEAVNAVGVAISRISLTMYARFDTEIGRATFNGEVEDSKFKQGSLPSDEEFIEAAKDKVLEVARTYGHKDEESVKVIYFNSYTVVRGGLKKGKIADIVVQIEPGISQDVKW
jgi:N-methylhydantoinase A/oxoprolinase/acetone carboxylase beta subunit